MRTNNIIENIEIIFSKIKVAISNPCENPLPSPPPLTFGDGSTPCQTKTGFYLHKFKLNQFKTMKAIGKVIKSTASSNGGFVNTLEVTTTQQITSFGVTETREVKKKMFFKSQNELKVGDTNEFSGEQWKISEIQKLDDTDGIIKVQYWISPKLVLG